MALLLAGALAIGQMQSVEDAVLQVLAAEASVSPTHLHEATLATQLAPLEYLLMTGELAPPAPPPSPEPPPTTVWDRLAVCESTSNWRANTGNGYYGGVQQDMTFWHRYGGLAHAPRPDLATRGQQIEIAERGLRVQGWGAWPACSRRLGLR